VWKWIGVNAARLWSCPISLLAVAFTKLLESSLETIGLCKWAHPFAHVATHMHCVEFMHDKCSLSSSLDGIIDQFNVGFCIE
jgi:hypothetical protein